jgi:hypothetical protein
VIAIGEYLFAGQQRGDAVGELDFAPGAAWLFANPVKNGRGQDVAAGDGQIGRGDARLRLLDQAARCPTRSADSGLPLTIP